MRPDPVASCGVVFPQQWPPDIFFSKSLKRVSHSTYTTSFYRRMVFRGAMTEATDVGLGEVDVCVVQLLYESFALLASGLFQINIASGQRK